VFDLVTREFWQASDLAVPRVLMPARERDDGVQSH